MNRQTTPSTDRLIVRVGAGSGQVPRRCALMSSVAGAVLLGLGVPAWAADCTSSNQTTFTTDSGKTELCLYPDANNAATTTDPYAIAIGSGAQATSGSRSQTILDYRGNGTLTLPNSNPGDSDLVSGTAIGHNTVVGPGGGVGIGYNNSAGYSSFMGVAIGANNAAGGSTSVAIGQANSADGLSSVSLGTANQATGDRAVAIGRQDYAYGDRSIAQGVIASAYGNNSIALGNAAVAGVASSTTTAVNDVAIGNSAQATGGSGLALGDGSTSSGIAAISIGRGTSVAEAYGTAIGQGASVSGAAGNGGDIAIGHGATASEGTAQTSAIAIGAGSTATTPSVGSPIALGYKASAVVSQNASGSPVAIGYAANATPASGNGSPVAIGDNANATGADAIAIGGHANATGSSATGDQSIAIGQSVKVSGVGAVAMGLNASAAQNYDLAIGNGAAASGGSSIALGNGAAAKGGKAVSIGAGNTATGDGAVAIGDPSNAVGTGAFAGGADNDVYGEGAVGIGNQNAVNSSGSPANGTVALGDGNKAAGQGSVALGFRSTATGAGSLAFGDTASATHAGGVALGSGAVDGSADQTKNGYTLATSGPISLGYDNRTGVDPGTISVGAGAGANAYRQVQNVADGSASHDAVNMEQLASVASQANGAISPLQAASKLAVQYTADANGNPTNAVDLTKSGTLGNVALTGLAPATTSTGAVALGQMPLQYSTANSPATANPGTASNHATLVGAQTGTVALHNLGPGGLDSASTDAVNGSQLYAAGHSAASIFGGGAAYSTATGQISAPDYTIGGTTYHDVGSALDAVDTKLGRVAGAFSSDNTAGVPDASAAGANAAAGGFGSSATGARSAVLGNSATDNGNADSTVLGMKASIAPNTPGSNVALGQGAVARSGALSGYTAFGLQPPQSAIGEVSVGSDNGTRRITNLAAGRDAGDGVNVAQLQGSASNLGTSTAAALGGGSQYSSSTGQISAPHYTIGGQTYTGVQNTFGAVDSSLTALQTSAGAFSSDNTAGAPKASATGHNALAGGFGASATGDGSAVLGNAATDNGVAKSTVLGMGAEIAPGTSGSNVALGQGAVANSGALSGYNAFGLRPTQNAIGEVSVGSAGGARRITNVAAGRDATDAVDVAQLSGAVEALPLQYSSAANPTVANPGVASQDVTLVGAAAGAVSLHNLAAGVVAAGSTDAVNGSQLFAGGQTIASAFGGGASYDTATGRLNAPAYVIGGTSYDNVGAALGAVNGSVSGGAGIKYFHANSVLADSDASGADALAAGPLALASGVDATALGTRASSTGINSVALGAGSTDGGMDNVVSVGAVGAERRIVNVAAGTLAPGSTDAATAGQLYAGGSSIASALGGGASYDTTTGQVTAPSYRVNGTSYASVGGAIGALDGAVSGGGIKYFHANSTLGDSAATGEDAVAVGPAAQASGIAAVALGRGAASTGSNSVALGAGSTDGGLANVVSVGAVGAERRITNVAAGTLAAGSTDAATAGQVYAGGSSVASILGGGAVYDAATGTVTAPSYAIGGSSYGTVGGALAALDGSVNGGAGIKYFHANSTLADSSATGSNAMAMGPAATASGAAGVAIGSGAASAGRNSVALGAGSTDGGQDNVVSVGAIGSERRVTNVAAGTLAQGSTDAVNGGQLFQTNQQVAALGHSAVQYATGADGRTLNAVSLSSDGGGPVVIHNLGAGAAATDAANVGQLRAATANAIQYDTAGGVRSNTVTFAGGQPGTVALQNVGPGVNGTDAVNLDQLNAASGAVLGQSQTYTDARVNNLAALTQQQIGQARSDAAAGTASALAASGLRYDDRPGRTAVAGAASYYHGQAGLAFGLGHTADDGHVRLNAAVTVSPTMVKPEVGAVVGGSWSFN